MQKHANAIYLMLISQLTKETVHQCQVSYVTIYVTHVK